jgi:hypothetical protein
MLADELDYVVGVDPHRDVHALAVVDVRTGGVVFEATAAADAEGYACVLRRVDQHARGRRVFAVEGTGSFGAGLARFLIDHQERVLEVGRLRRERQSGKPTIAYINRRVQEGKSRREATRCLKRYLARNLYRLLEHGAPLAT